MALHERISELENKCDRLITVIAEMQDKLRGARWKAIEECAKWLEDMPEHWKTLAAEMRRDLIKNDNFTSGT